MLCQNSWVAGFLDRAFRMHAEGQLIAAVAIYRRLLAGQPHRPDILGLLGAALDRLGESEGAIRLLNRTIGLDRADVCAYCNLGEALRRGGHQQAALKSLRIALVLDPGLAEAFNNLAALENSMPAARRALVLSPNLPPAAFNLGNLFLADGDWITATACFKRALIFAPGFANACNNLGLATMELGIHDQAASLGIRALAIDPRHRQATATVLFSLLYGAGPDLSRLRVVADAWNGSHPSAAVTPLAVTTVRHRPPRVGFVSADLRMHAVGLLAVPVVEALKRIGRPVICYANNPQFDPLTRRFRSAAQIWRCIHGLSDSGLEDLVRADGVDILVDLSGFSAGQRLAAFTRRPAPVQVSWLGYPGTTGIPVMDYLLADRHQVPASLDKFYSEKVVRLPDGYVSFEAVTDSVPGNRSPGPLTFGCFNPLKKITSSALRAWARILGEVDGSRLLLKAPGLENAGIRRYWLERLKCHGLPTDRLMLQGATHQSEHMAAMAGADIALDTMPYSGGRTCLEVLWMGVPVVTLPGETIASRHSFAYLRTLGLNDLVAQDIDGYVALAVRLAHDAGWRQNLRISLRKVMAGSALCDHERFARTLAAAFQAMWDIHLSGAPPRSFDL